MDALPAHDAPCPPTFALFEAFCGPEESARLVERVNSAPQPKWKQLSNRRLQQWGGVPSPQGMLPEPLPNWSVPICGKLASLRVFDLAGAPDASGEGAAPNHLLVNEYLPGQGILGHTDGPLYFPCVATLSLGAHCVLDFELIADAAADPGGDALFWTADDGKRYPTRFAVHVPPGSLYVQLDPLYSRYRHAIAERAEDSLDSYALTLEEYSSQGTGTEGGGSGIRGLLLNPWQGERTIGRGTRVSLTFRVVRKVLKAKALKNLLGKR
ncbi:hypothetical protein DFJ74DRAFT_603236 [Hyaloraphidium curvatum]|nr:hypothetical protein DFJ74DRAFT_603236 [Hyaloraphidium curvatum]